MPKSRISRILAILALLLVALTLATGSMSFGGDGTSASDPIDFHFGW